MKEAESALRRPCRSPWRAMSLGPRRLPQRPSYPLVQSRCRPLTSAVGAPVDAAELAQRGPRLSLRHGQEQPLRLRDPRLLGRQQRAADPLRLSRAGWGGI